MRELIPRHIRRRLAALRGKSEDASTPAAPAPRGRRGSLAMVAPDRLPECWEIDTALGPCLSFRVSPGFASPEFESRLAAAVTSLAGTLPLLPHRSVFLDLETLGLSAAPVFLVGMLHLGRESFHVHQFLARDYTEEGAVLEAAGPFLTGADCLLTYNGRSFDWPFLADRRRLHLMEPLPVMRHLDLLPVARRLYRGVLSSCSLNMVEREALGVVRDGDIPGRDIAELYHLAVAQEHLDLLAPVLYHNLVDLLSLACLAAEWREHLSS
jgi:hypothetical protein